MGARATGVMRVTRSPIFSGGPAQSQRQPHRSGSTRRLGCSRHGRDARPLFADLCKGRNVSIAACALKHS